MPEIPAADIDTMVVDVLVEALNADRADAVPEASLQMDLGMESIDLLDIMFRVERRISMLAFESRIQLARPLTTTDDVAGQEFDGMMTADQQRHLLESGFADLMGKFHKAQAPVAEQQVSRERWDGSAPGTVGRLQAIARRLARPAQPDAHS